MFMVLTNPSDTFPAWSAGIIRRANLQGMEPIKELGPRHLVNLRYRLLDDNRALHHATPDDLLRHALQIRLLPSIGPTSSGDSGKVRGPTSNPHIGFFALLYPITSKT
jgi:hypothetical protein